MKNSQSLPHYAISEAPPKADTSHIKNRILDIPYANLSSAQKLDIYLPDGTATPYSVIMAFHGGAFMGCDKADLQILPMLEGLQRGYAVVAVNYRMSGEAEFPALIQDAKAAVRWLRANADKYALNPNRIAAWGGSAGGYLSTMLGVSAGVPELEDLSLGNEKQPSNVQAVVSWFGPTNFLTMDEYLAENNLLAPPGFRHNEANSPESLLLGQKITEIPEKVKAANPETYIRDNLPPFLLQHGTADPVVPVQHSIQLAERLRLVAGEEKIILELLEGAEHGDERFETAKNVSRVLDFLDKYLLAA